MTNSELKAYIKAHRHDESACHEALKLLMSRRSENTPKYSYDLPIGGWTLKNDGQAKGNSDYC